jgi:transposase InsO family protein
LIAAVATDGPVNVSALARELGVAPKTIRLWRRRFAAEGLSGLEERSRRPHRSPQQTPLEVEELVVSLRKQLAEAGLDNGPQTIVWHLAQRLEQPPSSATVWRILVRRGFVVPAPNKRPRSTYRRFEAAAPNERWQIDATEWFLRDGRRVEIVNIVDDHSRLVVGARAVHTTTTDNAWETFSTAIGRWGLPLCCLSDNGLAFSGKLRGMEVAFEKKLRAAGIRPATARPHHPQTCGKVERFQQTEKKWLRARRRARTLQELQAQLDAFCDYYNDHRPHAGIGRVTPRARWDATPPLSNPGVALSAPVRRARVRVNPRGLIAPEPWVISLGVEFAGLEADVTIEGLHVVVFIDGDLIRHLILDPSRPYQPSGRRRGGPKRPRLASTGTDVSRHPRDLCRAT